ncbi:MAG: hypothetical protein P4L35_19740, partial [Ignavibacteriaceae bacterium]|nr:hypothetical protein [Ignavibacteriaceae bacterium]
EVYNRLSLAFDNLKSTSPDSPAPTGPNTTSAESNTPTSPHISPDTPYSVSISSPSSTGTPPPAVETTPANSTTPPSTTGQSSPLDTTPAGSSSDSPDSTAPTFVSEQLLNEIVDKITTVPDSFNLHPKLRKFLDKRRELISGSSPVDWAFAEALAFGTLLSEGTPVRLSGQDSVRGTFSQRHLALSDIINGSEYIPLNNISSGQAHLEALDSLLSEAAVLGFEYGYSTADPLALVLWEAQFGDFANGAQIIIDNFIAVSYEKWQLRNSVVLLLPHGYEGQGPEHSSARLERFLTLCAQDNLQVCYITTPAQYFHLLRRQIKNPERKPLVIITPKSLLRLPEARSPKIQFLSGRFNEIIDDEIKQKNSIKRIILTSGKVYYELLKYRTVNKITDSAIIRIEQFYPYKSDMIKEILSAYTSSDKVVWVQEEPKNMGAWNFLSSRLIGDLPPTCMLFYSGRPESASPAVGSAKIDHLQQSDLISSAFTL